MWWLSIIIWFLNHNVVSIKWFLNHYMVSIIWFLNQKMVSQNMVSQSKNGIPKYGFSIKKWFPKIWFLNQKMVSQNMVSQSKKWLTKIFSTPWLKKNCFSIILLFNAPANVKLKTICFLFNGFIKIFFKKRVTTYFSILW